jgi:hypothetical protein
MPDNTELDELRDIVRNIDAVGENGFEGLMAVALTEITSTVFNLAKSGSQHGKDGSSALNAGSLAFEGKRYDRAVPKNEVLSKIAEIAGNDQGNVDLWILGATAPVSIQDISAIEAVGSRLAVGTLILDWPAIALPPLATLLAMATGPTAAFLGRLSGRPEADIRSMLDAVRRHSQFIDRVQELKKVLDQPSLAPAYSLPRNRAHLKRAFTSVRNARATFGQALAPGDESQGVLDRATLRDDLTRAAFEKVASSVVFILGADGNGKSWLFGQTWLRQTLPPLTLVLMAADFTPLTPVSDIEQFLIAALIAQTADSPTEIVRRRWGRHFDYWKRNRAYNSLRLVVYVDGVNQWPLLPWVQLLEKLFRVLEELGGNLVVSCRTPFFRSTLKDRLIDPVHPIDVPNWSYLELRQLLHAHEIAIEKLKPGIGEFLRNPRIFAIAFRLFQKGEIERFSELSVSRLLFEYILNGTSASSARSSPDEFRRVMKNHADRIIERLRTTDKSDLMVFERPSHFTSEQASLEAQLTMISEGRFFEDVTGDSSLYVLRDDSLPLALGLSILAEARRLQRSKRPIASGLFGILDPISALDITADILFSAVIVGVVDEVTPSEVIAALVASLAGLQNFDHSRFEEVRALSRRATAPFLQGLEDAILSGNSPPNLVWLTNALIGNRTIPHCSVAIGAFVRRWLSLYSLAPERRLFSRDPPGNEARDEEYAKRKNALATAIAAFSRAEADLLSSLVREERDAHAPLHRIAFDFLSGEPLAPFAGALRDWCFAVSLNGGFYAAHDEFNFLVRFNCVDWSETRDEILQAAEPLAAAGTSATGLWALVYLLRATGASADADRAYAIEELLTKDWQRSGGWRFVESLCSSDPCDPGSSDPDNIAETAMKYAALDVRKVGAVNVSTSEDRLLDEAMPGLARFNMESAISTMDRLALDVLTRRGDALRFGVTLLERHTAALTDNIARQFVAKAYQVANAALATEVEDKEIFFTSQYCLMIAFPHIAGNAQLEALEGCPNFPNLLLTFNELMDDAEPERFEATLERVHREGNTTSLFRLMAFAQSTMTIMSERSKVIISKHISSTDDLVRLCAIGTSLRLEDPMLLKAIVDSGWTASAFRSTPDRTEIWYGSHALVAAAVQGQISLEDCLDRIDFNAYTSVVKRLGLQGVEKVSACLDAAIGRTANHLVSTSLPKIERPLESGTSPTLLNIDDQGDAQENVADGLLFSDEPRDAWNERQARLRNTVNEFQRELTAVGSQLILRSLPVDLVMEVFERKPEVVRNWAKFLTAASNSALANLHNFALLVVEVTSSEDEKGAVELFRRIVSTEPAMRVTLWDGTVSLEAFVVWKAGKVPDFRELCFRRLDQAHNDHVLASEVLAGLRAGQIELIRQYVSQRHVRPEPAYVARAIMVAGFCEDTAWTQEVLAAHQNDRGFLGEAYAAARAAMDRLRWAKHWASRRMKATTTKDFWRYTVLLAKIIDGRLIDSWTLQVSDPGIARYSPTSRDLFQRRVAVWKRKREGSLFGGKVPGRNFLA